MRSEEKIRTFIAIKISPELEAALNAFLEELRKIRCDIKWVKAEGVHLTLKFLGNIPYADVLKISDGVVKAVQGFGSLRLRTGEKGAFPSLKRPRVFWVDLGEDNDRNLLEVQSQIEEKLSELGFEKERRRFHPHLTVGRVRSPKNIEEVTRKFMENPFPEIAFNVDQILIMKSDLTPKGAVYTVQKTVPLKSDK